MKNRLTAKLLSLAMSVAMTMTSGVPVYATDIIPAPEEESEFFSDQEDVGNEGIDTFEETEAYFEDQQNSERDDATLQPEEDLENASEDEEEILDEDTEVSDETGAEEAELLSDTENEEAELQNAIPTDARVKFAEDTDYEWASYFVYADAENHEFSQTAELTKDLHEFKYWYYIKDGAEVKVEPIRTDNGKEIYILTEEMLSDDDGEDDTVTLFPKWELRYDTITVNYYVPVLDESGNPTGNVQIYNTKTLKPNEGYFYYEYLEEPTLKKHAFNDWYNFPETLAEYEEEENFSKLGESQCMVGAGSTVIDIQIANSEGRSAVVNAYAHWRSAKYTIVFEKGEGYFDKYARSGIYENQYIGSYLYFPNPGEVLRTGYILSGWKNSKTGEMYAPGNDSYSYEEPTLTEEMCDENFVATFEAQWTTVTKYMLLLDYTETEYMVEVGQTYPELPDGESYTGSYFDGWYYNGKEIIPGVTKVEAPTEDPIYCAYSFDESTLTSEHTYIPVIRLRSKRTPVEYEVVYHLNRTSRDLTTTKVYTTRDSKVPLDVSKGSLSSNSAFNSDGFEKWTGSDGHEYGLEDTVWSIIKNNPGSGAKKVTVELYAQWKGDGPFNFEIRAFDDEALKAFDLEGEDFSRSDYSISEKADLIQHDTVNVRETITLTGTEFVRAGYTLTGWTYKKTVGGKTTTTTLKPSATIKETVKPDYAAFTAIWSNPVTYTVKYDLNGGSLKNNNESLTVTYNWKDNKEKTALLNYECSDNAFVLKAADAMDVTRTGYRFNGWIMSGTFYDHYAGDIYKNLSLKADWVPVSYRITINANPGYMLMNNANGARYSTIWANVAYDQGISLKSIKFVRDGYTFKNLVDENGKTYSGKEALMNLADTDGKEVVLTVEWKGNSNKLTYKLGGGAIPKAKDGSRQSNPSRYVSGEKVTLIAPEKKGYVFKEWKISQNGVAAGMETVSLEASEDSVAPDTITGSSHGAATLTAVYEPVKYKVRLYANVGADELKNSNDSFVDTSATVYDQPLSFADYTKDVEALLTADSLSAKTILSFNTKPDGKGTKYTLDKLYSKLYDRDAESAGGDYEPLKLYAQYSATKIYHVYYDLDGGELKKPVATYTPGAVARIPNPSRKGYSFGGWIVTDASTGVEFDKEAPRFEENAKTYALSILKSADNNCDLSLTAQWDAISYTVKAEDKYGATGKLVGGVVFDYEGNAEDDIYYLNTTGKEGYAFMGLYTGKNGKGVKIAGAGENGDDLYTDGGWAYPADSFAGLSTKNNATVKVYAYYKPVGSLVSYHSEALVYYDAARSLHAPSITLNRTASLAQFGKEFKLPTISVTGYTFLGWKIYNQDTQSFYDKASDCKIDLPKLKVTESRAGYVTKIKKDSLSDVTVVPVFVMNKYKLNFNTQGGTVTNPKTGKAYKGNQTIDELHYSDSISSTCLSSMIDVSKKGYRFVGIAADSKGKDMIMDSDGNYTARYNGRSRLVSKNNGTLTAYAIWEKTGTVKVENVSAVLFGAGGNKTLRVRVADEVAGLHRYKVEYSTDSKFKKTLTQTAYINVNSDYAEISGLSGNAYYVRVCSADLDSGYNDVTGKWSKTVRSKATTK